MGGLSRTLRLLEQRLMRMTAPLDGQKEPAAVSHDEVEGLDLASAEVLLHQAERVLDEQQARFDGLDTKASIIAGFDGVIVGALTDRILDRSTPIGFSRVPLLLAAGALMLSASMAVRAYWPARFTTVPNLTRLRTDYFGWKQDQLRYLVFCWTEAAADQNSRVLAAKVAHLKAAMLWLLVGLALALAAMVSVLL
jgi:hypothetical protein